MLVLVRYHLCMVIITFIVSLPSPLFLLSFIIFTIVIIPSSEFSIMIIIPSWISYVLLITYHNLFSFFLFLLLVLVLLPNIIIVLVMSIVIIIIIIVVVVIVIIICLCHWLSDLQVS